MLRITSKIAPPLQLLKTSKKSPPIKCRFVSSTPTQLINRNTTPYKEDHLLHKNKAENNKPKKPHKQLTTEERIKQDLERARRIEEARYLYARPGQKNK